MRAIVISSCAALSVAAALLLSWKGEESDHSEAAFENLDQPDEDDVATTTSPSPSAHVPSTRAPTKAQPIAAARVNVPKVATQRVAIDLEHGDEEPSTESPADAAVTLPFAKLEQTWLSEHDNPESTKNGAALADSFVTEVGLAPESVESVTCRQTLCKVALKQDLPFEQLLAVKEELSQSGILTSADWTVGEDGQFQVKSAFLPREGHEQQMLDSAPKAVEAP